MKLSECGVGTPVMIAAIVASAPGEPEPWPDGPEWGLVGSGDGEPELRFDYDVPYVTFHQWRLEFAEPMQGWIVGAGRSWTGPMHAICSMDGMISYVPSGRSVEHAVIFCSYGQLVFPEIVALCSDIELGHIEEAI